MGALHGCMRTHDRRTRLSARQAHQPAAAAALASQRFTCVHHRLLASPRLNQAGRPLLVGVRPLQLWPLLLCKALLKVMAAYRVLHLNLPHQVCRGCMGESVTHLGPRDAVLAQRGSAQRQERAQLTGLPPCVLPPAGGCIPHAHRLGPGGPSGPIVR